MVVLKKLSKIFTLFVLSLAVALSATGCSFINTGNSGGVKSGGGTTSDSLISAQSVSVTQTDITERERLSLPEAIEKVERCSVAIKIQSSNSTSYGSGIIVDFQSDDRGENQYYILTCHHVISGGGDLTVYLPDENLKNFTDDGYNSVYAFTGVIGSEIYNNAVTLVGGDKDADVAVLKLDISGSTIDSAHVVEAKVPPSTYAIKKGEEVFAIGNPSGLLPGTVSVGHISYINRSEIVSNVGEMSLLQIDVQTNPGNSGGGLFNMYGELIGITNAGDTNYEGINFAIPLSNSSEATNDTGFINIAKQLIGTKTDTNYGYVSGRWQFGISISTGLDYSGEYVYISSISESDNAYNSGLRLKDIIESVSYVDNGEKKTVNIDSESSYASVVYKLKKLFKVGDSFVIKVSRLDYNRYTQHDITINLYTQFIFANTGN